MNSQTPTETVPQCGSDDEVPEIDYGDPIHELKREPSFVRDSQPSYDVLSNGVAELNQSIFETLRKGSEHRSEENDDNEKESDDMENDPTSDGFNTGNNVVLDQKIENHDERARLRIDNENSDKDFPNEESEVVNTETREQNNNDTYSKREKNADDKTESAESAESADGSSGESGDTENQQSRQKIKK